MWFFSKKGHQKTVLFSKMKVKEYMIVLFTFVEAQELFKQNDSSSITVSGC